MLFVQAIAADLATNPAAASTSPVVNSEQRNKKAIKASQSPITYVQHLVEPDSKIIRPKWNKAKKTDKKKNMMSNHDLLTMLGLAKLPSPNNHHRKRLATQSRHVGRPDDSRVFIVKLPPNPYYYSHPDSHKSTVNEPNSIDNKSKKVICCIIVTFSYLMLQLVSPPTDSRWLQIEWKAWRDLPLEFARAVKNN